jgi:pimeloyl-ACP methyl ester carboxylesterase
VNPPNPLGVSLPNVLLPSLGALWRGTMIVLGVAAGLPARAGDVRSHAHPAGTYGDAVARAERMVIERDSDAVAGGETIFLTHGYRAPRAVVLFHGLTDSPRQFAALADSLFADGDNVLVPRLPRHAERHKDVRALARLTPGELCRLADASIDIAAGLGDSVIVMGLSIGGTLAAWTAEHRHEVRRAIVISPAFEAARVPSLLERPLVNLGAHLPNLSRRSSPDPDHLDRDPGFATHGLAAVLRLGMAVRGDADRHAPEGEVLFVINDHDHTVKAGPVLDLARAWRRQAVPVSVYELPDSLGLPHNVMDPLGGTPTTVVPPVLLSLARSADAPRWVARR